MSLKRKMHVAANGPTVSESPEPEKLLSEFFNSSSVGLAIFDKQLRYRMLNPFLAQWNGNCVESHLGKHIREILGQLATQIEPMIQHVFATARSIVNCEIVGAFPTKAGGGRWINNFFPVRDTDGSVAYVGVVVVELAKDIELRTAGYNTSPGNRVLRSWKEIASYVGACAKTVQRWEQRHKFPIRRVKASKGAVVFAIRNEVDNWLSHGARAALSDKRSWATFIDSPLPTLILDDDRMILDANVSMASLISLSPDNLVQKTLDDFISATNTACTEREWLLVRQTGALVGLRNFRRIDGVVFGAEYTLRTVQPGIRMLTFTSIHQEPVTEKKISYRAGPTRVRDSSQFENLSAGT